MNNELASEVLGGIGLQAFFIYLFTFKAGIAFFVSKLHLIRLSYKSSPSFWEEYFLKEWFCNSLTVCGLWLF